MKSDLNMKLIYEYEKVKELNTNPKKQKEDSWINRRLSLYVELAFHSNINNKTMEHLLYKKHQDAICLKQKKTTL